MKQSEVFEVTLNGMHSLIIPDEVARPFLEAGQSRVQVSAEFEGKAIHFHAALQKDKQGLIRVTFGQKLQKELGVFHNDYFNLILTEDRSKYGVDMPEELEAVLTSDQAAFDAFESLTPGKQRSIIYYILRYKSPQTRVDKALMIVHNLKIGVTDSKGLFKRH